MEIDILIADRARITKVHVPKVGPRIGQMTNKELLRRQRTCMSDCTITNCSASDSVVSSRGTRNLGSFSQIEGAVSALWKRSRLNLTPEMG